MKSSNDLETLEEIISHPSFIGYWGTWTENDSQILEGSSLEGFYTLLMVPEDTENP